MDNRKSNTKDREIFLSRTLNAQVELVWEMWTNPEHVANWWGPDGFTSTISIMNIVPGGKWDLVMHGPDGTNYNNESIFKEVVQYQKIVYEHISEPKFISTVEFDAQGEKTLLTWLMLFETAEQLIEIVKKYGAKEGLKQNVAKLETYLAGKRA